MKRREDIDPRATRLIAEKTKENPIAVLVEKLKKVLSLISCDYYLCEIH